MKQEHVASSGKRQKVMQNGLTQGVTPYPIANDIVFRMMMTVMILSPASSLYESMQ